MGLLESIVAGIEDLGREKDAEDDAGFRKVAERLAEKEAGWVKGEVNGILMEAMSLQVSGMSVMEIQKKMADRLTKFAEEAFQRGAKAASRMNVIQGP